LTILLVNELATGEEILHLLANAGVDEIMRSPELVNQRISEFKTLCSKARDAWALAVFSDAPKESLERYFSFHLRLLTGFSEKLCSIPDYPLPECTCVPSETINSSFDKEINQLTDHLFQYFRDYPDKNILVPLSYHTHVIKTMLPGVNLIKASIEFSAIPCVIKSEVIAYLDHLVNAGESAPLTFRQLIYFQAFVKEIKTLLSNASPGNLTGAFTDKLLELEFNHMEIFTYLQEEISKSLTCDQEGEKLSLLEKEAVQMHLSQKESNERYDVRWPKLSIMLEKWLLTEISALKEKRNMQQCSCTRTNYKLKLELSVAHLACLLRLFKKEGLLGAVQLTALFKFSSDHFSTKRAETVSNFGISKAYYSVTQVIAAEVKDMLLKMIQRINHDYFPVMAAVSIIIYAC
jgi:hypothetical protein